MSSIRINKELNNEMYFITITVKNWYYLFDRHNRWEILLDSLKYCQKNKWLKIYSWVFMINHIHMIIKSNDVSWFIRDFKSFTTHELKKNIIATEPRIINLFNNNWNWNNNLWQDTNMPELIETERFFNCKKIYIENNPVRKSYVKNPENWIYSSANSDNLLALSKIDE